MPRATSYNTSSLARDDCTLVLDGVVCAVSLWEAPGTEYNLVPPLFNRAGHRQRQRIGGLDTRGVCGFILLYDVRSRASFEGERGRAGAGVV